MSQIETCYLRDSEGCDLESCDECGYYKLVVESANSTQQLKTKIRASLYKLCNCPPVDLSKAIDEHVAEMRKLSAVKQDVV